MEPHRQKDQSRHRSATTTKTKGITQTERPKAPGFDYHTNPKGLRRIPRARVSKFTFPSRGSRWFQRRRLFPPGPDTPAVHPLAWAYANQSTSPATSLWQPKRQIGSKDRGPKTEGSESETNAIGGTVATKDGIIPLV